MAGSIAGAATSDPNLMPKWLTTSDRQPQSLFVKQHAGLRSFHARDELMQGRKKANIKDLEG
jgi:hypothetical protein